MFKRRLKKLRGEKIIALSISMFFLLLYVYLQSTSIYGGDGGDLVAAAYVKGVAHPPGYPLYTFLGWLFTKLPIFSVAWRVGFLSSIPAAASLGIFFLICQKLLKKTSVSITTVFSLGFTYLFWLYAVIAEVFALHIFFVLLLLYLSLQIKDTGKIKYIYLFSLFFGLSLTHHHTILFIVPAYLYLILPAIKKIYLKPSVCLPCLFLFLIGLLPYYYVYWAAGSNPFINWENPQDLNGFLRLVSRAIYGTFSSGNFLPGQTYDRYYQAKNAWDTLMIDFTPLGIILFISGAVFQQKTNLKLFLANLMFVWLAGPVFIFYAAFPVLLNFYLGTVERFYLVPYIFLFIWVGYGIKYLSEMVDRIIQKIITRQPVFSSVYIFFLLPILLFYMNLPRILPLKNDSTAENLAEDILHTVSDDALVFLADDTSLFNTQYYFLTTGGKKAWRNIKILQVGTLSHKFYQDAVSASYPEINFSNSEDLKMIFQKLVDDNFDKRPIFSNVQLAVNQEYAWLPQGLLKRLYKTSDLQTFSTAEFLKINSDLFSGYHDPFSGALSIYMHPLLADVARVYSRAYVDAGDALIKTDKYMFAEDYYKKAIRLQPEFLDLKQKLAKAYILEKKCDSAEEILLENHKIYTNDLTTFNLLIELYRDCKSDKTEVQNYTDLLDKYIRENKSDLTDFN